MERRELWIPALVLALSGCATVLPMQSASALPEGQWRVEAQAAIAPWCGVSGNLSSGCAYNPGGTPLPEGRVSVQRGLADAAELGASAHWSGYAPPGSGDGLSQRFGLLVQGKQEVWSRELSPGNRQILSVGGGVGAELVSIRPDVRRLGFEGLIVLPVYFGHQTNNFEWVGRLAFVERFADPTLDLEGQRPQVDLGELDLAVSLLRRAPGHWGVELGYRAPTGRLGDGAFHVSFGLGFAL